MKNFLTASAIAFATALSTPAHANLVVNFEATGQSASGCGAAVTSTASNGYTFTSFHHHICTSAGGLFTNGTSTLLVDGGPTVTMTKVGGGTFTLNALDAAEQWTTGSSRSYSLLIEALLFGGGTASQTLAFDGIFDGAGSQVDFQSFNVSAAFTNVVSVSFTALSAGGARQANYQLDNIVVNAGRLPEPGSILLVGGALLGLGAARRQAKRA